MRKKFDFYPYGYPKNGIVYVEDVPYRVSEDMRTVKRFREFKNVGFTRLLLQAEESYNGGEPFENSNCAYVMRIARKAGIKRIILSDQRLKDLCEEDVLVGEHGRFSNEEELETYISDCVAPYRNEEGFFGLQLRDEPKRHMLASYGKVCRTLKKLIPGVYLQCNLFPVTDHVQLEGEDIFQAYEKYLTEFLEESGMDSILFDEYPFRRDYIIGGHSIVTRQIAARVCKKFGVEFRMVMQSFSMITPKPGGRVHLICRPVTEQDMYYQSNMAMGFGCREYSYYTYNTRTLNWFDGEYNPDGASFINSDGTRTKLYDFTRRIIKEMKAFAPVALRHTYDGCWFAFEKGKGAKDFMQTEFAEVDESCPIDVEVSYSVALITRMVGEKSDLFMIQNIGNVKGEYFGNAAPMRVTVDFKKPIKAKFYKFGKRIRKKTKDGKFEEDLRVGDAIFVEVKKN